MNTILTAPQITYSDRLLESFKTYKDSAELSGKDLFEFLTTPTAEREEFFALYCNREYSNVDNIMIQRITAK